MSRSPDSPGRHQIRAALGAAIASLLLVAALAPEAPEDDGPSLEAVSRVPELLGATSTVSIDDQVYVSHRGGLSVVDLSSPVEPRTRHLMTSPNPVIGDESLEVGGSLLVASSGGAGCNVGHCQILVFDVDDPSDPRLLSTILQRHHNVTCIDECRHLYTSEGRIIDLTTPTAPAMLGYASEIIRGHDIVEVSPGRAVVIDGTRAYVDTSTPAHPRRLPADVPGTTAKSADWPHHGDSPIMFISQFGRLGDHERCSGHHIGVLVVDTTEVLALDAGEADAAAFRVVDRLDIDSQRPGKSWIQCGTDVAPHPSFTNNGLVAVGSTDHGLSLHHVGPDVPAQVLWSQDEAATSDATGASAYLDVSWHDDELLVVSDWNLGLEILRLQ